MKKQKTKRYVHQETRTYVEDEQVVDIEQYNREYDDITRRMDAGEGVPHEHVVKLVKEWKKARK